MAIGVISSPSAWYNGTIAPPDWFKTAQDNSNYAYRALQGLYSAKSIYLDGTGNQPVSIGDGELIIQAPGTSDLSPRMLFKDSSGNNRWLVDKNGLPGGYVTAYQEDWLGKMPALVTPASPGVQVADSRFYAIERGAGVSVAESSLSGYANRLPLLSTNSSNGQGIYMATFHMFTPSANSVIVMEWDAAFNSATTNCSTYMGMTNYDGGAGFIGDYTFNTDGAWFQKTASDTYWQCYTTDGVTATTSAGADAPVTGTMQQFRIELHGANTPVGSSARFYINQHLRGTLTTHLPNSPLCLIFYIINQNASSHSIHIGPVRLAWNRYLSPTAF